MFGEGSATVNLNIPSLLVGDPLAICQGFTCFFGAGIEEIYANCAVLGSHEGEKNWEF